MNQEDISLLENLPDESLYEILMKFPIETLNKVCFASKRLNNFYQDVNFWAEKAESELKFPRKAFIDHINEFEDPRKEYVQIYTYKNNPDKYLPIAAGNGNLDMVNYLVTCGGFKYISLQEALFSAIKHNRMNVFEFLITSGHLPPIYILRGMALAIDEDNLDIVKYLIENKYSPNPPEDLNDALSWAAEAGKLDIVKYLIQQGANDLNSALWYSADHDQLAIVKYLVEAGATNLEDTLAMAEQKELKDIVKYLTSIM